MDSQIVDIVSFLPTWPGPRPPEIDWFQARYLHVFAKFRLRVAMT